MAVFLFHGEDTYSLQKKMQFWRREFEKKHGDINVTVFDGASASANEIFQACSAVPFLGEKRLTIIRNFFPEASDEEKSFMAEKIECIPDFCTCVFAEMHGIDRRVSLFKKIQKFGTITEFEPITGSRLLSWIQAKIKEQSGLIERDAILALAESVPADLHRLENEIHKLLNFARGRAITRQDVHTLVDSELEISIFKLTDSIGGRNAKSSLAVLHRLIETGEEMHRILFMIMRQFRIIVCVKDLLSKGLSKEAIAGKLREHPFVIGNTMAQARNFSADQLKRAYELLVDIDTRLKTGGIKVLAGDSREFVLALDRLVLNLCA